jgi:hypothetical protein
MPVAAQGAESTSCSQAAVAAIADAAMLARKRTASSSAGFGVRQHHAVAEQLVTSLRTLVPTWRPSRRRSASTRRRWCLRRRHGDRPVPNSGLRRASQPPRPRRFCHTIDAARAPVAVDQACRELRAGDADVVIAGASTLPRRRV